MSKNVRCTLTGADDNTSIDNLIRLSREYPFVEWGILLSLTRVGTPRYPSLDWIYEFGNKIYNDNQGVDIALHVCGNTFVENFINNPNAYSFIKYYNRVQLNLDYENVNTKIFLDNLIAKYQYRSYDFEKRFILQYNNNTKYIVEHLIEEHDFFDVLMDSSRGTGIPISEFYVPYSLQGKNVAFAGGINTSNIIDVFTQIISASIDNNLPIIGLDMESGLRTDDEFVLQKCDFVLNAIHDFMLG